MVPHHHRIPLARLQPLSAARTRSAFRRASTIVLGVTVSDELTKRGEINRIGGPAYLHELIQTVPTAANAGYYAEIVRSVPSCAGWSTPAPRLSSSGYGQDGEVEDLVNQAQAEIYAVAERRTAEDYVVLKDVMESTVDEIEASGHRGEG